MTKPILLTVDDDPQVLRAVARDLKRRYGKDYSILRADSGPSALEALAELKQRGDPVALLLSDHRMPRMQGVEFLGRARALYPDAGALTEVGGSASRRSTGSDPPLNADSSPSRR